MSREAELYKDKIEVSLDGRQIFYLFFGGSVIVGLVFVLGVMVGRRVEARGHIDRARVAATVDPLAALDRLEGGNALSFQGALRGNDAPASDVEKQIAAMEAKPLDKPVKGDKAKKAEAKAPEVKNDAKDQPKADKAKLEEPKKADKPKLDEPKKAEPKKVDQVAKADEPKNKDDAKKADEPKKDEKKAEEKKRYTLQLSAFQEKNDAEALLASVKAAGYDAYIAEGTVDGKQYFRVRTGTYKSMEAATEAKSDLEKISNKSAMVTRL
jgi:cell division protein FtsN